MNKTELRELSQRLRKQLVQRFVFFYLLYLAVGAAVFVLAYLYYQSRIWYGYETFYQLVHLLERFWAFLLPVYAGGGALGLGCYYIKKACAYLDELVTASENLFLGREQDAPLSEELKPIEVYLDSVRLQIQNSQRAAREAEQRKNDLVVYLAHDLKTPLTSVIGYLTLLNDEEEISLKLQKKYLSVSLDKAERLEDLINEFFDITRFNLTNLTLEMSKVNLTRMLEQILYEFKPLFAEKNLDYCLDVPVNVEIRCDVNKLERVFDNLIRNAVNYSFPDTVIEVTLIRREDSVIIYVKNQGNTIPPEKLERIFQQFYRVDSSRSSKTGGAGLGLAIAKEIVELHQGAITAFSENDQIQFSIYLPDHLRREEAEKSDG